VFLNSQECVLPEKNEHFPHSNTKTQKEGGEGWHYIQLNRMSQAHTRLCLARYSQSLQVFIWMAYKVI